MAEKSDKPKQSTGQRHTRDVEWEEILKQVATSNILTNLKREIDKIVVACGYSYEDAEKVLSIYIVEKKGAHNYPFFAEKTLEYLSSKEKEKEESESSLVILRGEMLANYILKVHFLELRRFMPMLSFPEGIWRLVLCGLDLNDARAMDYCNLSVAAKAFCSTKASSSSIASTSRDPPKTLQSVALEPKLGSCIKSTKKSKKEAKLLQRKVDQMRHAGASGSMIETFERRNDDDDKESNFVAVVNVNNEAVRVEIPKNSEKIDLPPMGPSSPPDERIRLGLGLPSNEIPEEKEDKENDGTSNSKSVKDDTIAFLRRKIPQLQIELIKWDEWINKKVMEATRRLTDVRAEIKQLKQEKEAEDESRERERIKEEENNKRIFQMKEALERAMILLGDLNLTSQRLREEKVGLKQKREIFKIEAKQAIANRDVALETERNLQKELDSIEKQRMLMEEELRKEKKRHQRDYAQYLSAKKNLDQLLEKTSKVEKEKENLVEQAAAIRREKEQMEAAVRAEEERMKREAEIGLQEYKDKIEKLKAEISELTNNPANNTAAPQENNNNDTGYISLPEIDVFYNCSDVMKTAGTASTCDDKRKNRECVMCHSKETKVLLLPCAHKPVCVGCNRLHELRGLKECPSCRTPIQQRVTVRYATSLPYLSKTT